MLSDAEAFSFERPSLPNACGSLRRIPFPAKDAPRMSRDTGVILLVEVSDLIVAGEDTSD
jgi:hypothetical protein